MNDAEVPDEEFFAELFDEAGAPHERTAEEVIAETRGGYVEAEEVYDQVTQEALALLAVAVDKLGGVLVIPKHELYVRYRISIDMKYHRETGGMRVYSYPRQES